MLSLPCVHPAVPMLSHRFMFRRAVLDMGTNNKQLLEDKFYLVSARSPSSPRAAHSRKYDLHSLLFICASKSEHHSLG